MQKFTDIVSIRSFLQSCKNKSIGLVPTMGSFHKGHLSLIERAKKENDIVICTVYINPTQFDRSTDFSSYPRDIEEDTKLLVLVSCDVLFAPTDKEMYPNGIKDLLKISFGKLSSSMEGLYRTGHFEGVSIVIAKFFNIIAPDRAYFGEKDIQQCLIIKKIVNDLSFPISIIISPTIREEDGLAMSSRNFLFTPEERAIAPNLYKTLLKIKDALTEGYDIKQARARGFDFLNSFSAFRLEYITIVGAETFEEVANYINEKEMIICIAAHLGKVRLIDNIILKKN